MRETCAAMAWSTVADRLRWPTSDRSVARFPASRVSVTFSLAIPDGSTFIPRRPARDGDVGTCSPTGVRRAVDRDLRRGAPAIEVGPRQRQVLAITPGLGGGGTCVRRRIGGCGRRAVVPVGLRVVAADGLRRSIHAEIRHAVAVEVLRRRYVAHLTERLSQQGVPVKVGLHVAPLQVASGRNIMADQLLQPPGQGEDVR